MPWVAFSSPANTGAICIGGFMSNRRSKILSLVFVACCVVFSATVINAQWGESPVVVYDLASGRGSSQGFDVGEYRNDRRQMSQIGNDRASSVSVAAGYQIRLCEKEGNNGGGQCEQYGEGYHNLLYSNTASYIQVTRTGDGNGGGWGNGNAGGNGAGNIGGRGVTVYDDRNYRGAVQSFGPGIYMNSARQLGTIRNDEASSVVVERGYKVRFCENEGSGRGDGKCEEYTEGRYNIRLNDEASYIEVTRTGGGWNNGGGWGNGNGNGNGNGGGWGNGNGNGNGDNAVIVYSEKNQRGDEQSFGAGTYRNDRNQLGNIKNDDATSIFVPRGYRVRICAGEYNNGSGRCEEFGPGSFNLRYNDEMSFIRVSRNGY